jgi:O-antigen/teichoic acid export membrane protein
MTTPEPLPPEVSVSTTPPALGVGEMAARGALALGARQIVVWVISLGSGIVLARLLSPADFGVFAIASFVLTAFMVFGDAGLGASLIRQQDEPSLADYRSVFFVQQAIVITVVVACWATASVVVSLYGLNESYAWFIRLMALGLLITSFQTISVIRLERRLAFPRLGMINAIEAATFSGTAIAFAVAGAGVYSFGAALVAQALVGATLYLTASPWRIGWERPTRELRSRLAFGIPYQGVGVVSLVKDSISPVFIGLSLGATQVGYVKWSQTLAAYALFAIQALQRLFMPTFARLQHDPERLRRAVESVLTACNAVVAPVAMITLVLAHPIAQVVYGDKWIPALPLFYAFWCANALVPTAAPVMGLLNALGSSRLVFSFAFLWFAGTWVLSVPLILTMGALGYGIATAALQITNLAFFRAAQRRAAFSIVKPAAFPWLLAAAAVAPAFALELAFPARSLWLLGAYASLALIAYAMLFARYGADYVQQVTRLAGIRLSWLDRVRTRTLRST